MLNKGYGFPLWCPQPSSNLPVVYQRRGIDIGDVGIMRADGTFDVCFNIYSDIHHSTLDHDRVPENFQPLQSPATSDILVRPSFQSGKPVTSRGVERQDVPDNERYPAMT